MTRRSAWLFVGIMVVGVLTIGATQEVTRKEFDALARRVQLLESRVISLQSQVKRLARAPAKRKKVQLDYQIAKIEDVSYAGVVRLQYRIRVSEKLTEAELRDICNIVIAQQKKVRPHNAITFFFYLPGSDTDRHFTAGQADWAPNGKWEDAGTVKTGDYSRHQLLVKVGSALGQVPEAEVVTSMPVSKRMKIFHDLVEAQDKGVGDEKAYDVIAKKYGIDVSTARKVGVEGAMKGWPMP